MPKREMNFECGLPSSRTLAYPDRRSRLWKEPPLRLLARGQGPEDNVIRTKRRDNRRERSHHTLRRSARTPIDCRTTTGRSVEVRQDLRSPVNPAVDFWSGGCERFQRFRLPPGQPPEPVSVRTVRLGDLGPYGQ